MRANRMQGSEHSGQDYPILARSGRKRLTIEAVADRSHGGDGAELDAPLRVDHCGVVRPVVGVVDDPVQPAAAFQAAILSARKGRISDRSVGATFHPTMRRE